MSSDGEVLHLADLAGSTGRVLGPGPWHAVDQNQVDLFAKATGDSQWIHGDPERASETSFGGTIAHGYLTLSLLLCHPTNATSAAGAPWSFRYLAPGDVQVVTLLDLVLGPTGRATTPAGRLEEILLRYPVGHPVHRAVTRSAPQLLVETARTRTRLRLAVGWPSR